ncbi:MAG: aminotransferase class V-fold PLP-dependent enzyme [Clostridia bacterium]|nr:aminotransferase class V-fold PLP-dependent enzyme [Clostridia bacterium]
MSLTEKLSFECDYTTGAHPEILKKLTETNIESLPGYGADRYCESAKEKIRNLCNNDVEVFFLVGGTQTNSIVIASLLNSYEGVIAADTGHVSVHEAGAIEYTGHKVLTLPHHDGKIMPTELSAYMDNFYNDENHEHMVFPGMVYISHPTENGTLYTKNELKQISDICRMYDIPLFLDGARLGYGLMSRNTDVTLPDIAELCDVFYIGGTKVGALCGEVVVFKKSATPKHFMTTVKQHGALLAKGRLLGVQFDTLFTDNLYFEISRHAIEMAEFLKTVLKEKGYHFAWESFTNQQFVILENKQMEKLKEKVRFSFWEKYDNSHTVVRFATSWSTKKEDIEKLKTIL